MRFANLPFKTDAICGEKAQESQLWWPEQLDSNIPREEASKRMTYNFWRDVL